MNADDGERLVVRALQVGLAGLVAFGVWQRQFGVVVNAAVSLGVTFLPALLEHDRRVSLDPALTLWITVAVSAHAVGALGVYRSVPWYDQFAHALSASVVAAVGYATVRALERYEDDVSFPGPFLVVVVVVVTLAFGVLWELLEFAVGGLGATLGGGKVLAILGLDDVALDLVFDAVGGVVVGVLGAGPFSDAARTLGRRLLGDASDR